MRNRSLGNYQHFLNIWLMKSYWQASISKDRKIPGKNMHVYIELQNSE